MENLWKILACLVVAASVIAQGEAQLEGCRNNSECTALCGFQGEGTCVDGKYCKCADCPGRSIYELATLPKICTLDPTCVCPMPVLSLTKGRIYTGHRCLYTPSLTQMPSLVCICFCLPTTPGAILDVLKCPVPKEKVSSTTTSPE